jgi:hypothetical protein
MRNFLRTHEINILKLQFRHSQKFRFKNKKEKNNIEDNMILSLEPHSYMRWNDEFNQESLKIKLSWVVVANFTSFIFLSFTFFNHHNQIVAYSLIVLSVFTFILGRIMMHYAKKFSFNIDFTKQLLSEDVIKSTRKIIQNRRHNII